MKKTILMFVGLTLCLTGIAFAENMFTDVTVDVSTYPAYGAGSTIPNSTVPNWLPEISSSTSKIYISKIMLSNSDAAVPQTITLYDNAQSTNTVTAIWSVIIPSGTYQAQVITLDFEPIRELRADYGLYIRKSDTTSTVIASVLYH